MLEGHLQEWLDLAFRWIHVIVGIAWIGTSFYFNWLNNHIRPPQSPEPGVAGELWSVHGGGFYRVVKYQVAPERLPTTLHWFKWEAYSTWASGVALLFVVYYLGPSGIAIDARRWDLPRWGLMLFGVGTLVAGWFAYDLLCRWLRSRPGWLATIGFGLAVGAAFGYSQVLTGRAAFIHTGALIGTLMAANVFFVIIPSQRKMVDAMSRGETPDPAPGAEAALRSLHNNYLTLPVVFIMVSNHFPSTFAAEWNWALLGGLALTGAAVRHWFNLRGRGQRNFWILPAAVAAMLALAVAAAPAEISGADVPDDVFAIVQMRCTPCHADEPTQPRVSAPPKGVVFETKADLAARAPLVAEVVASGFMPRNNATLMTDEERARVVEWARGG
ncbi:MAG TPA: hypothetical protein DCY40_03875 [Actinobacteria bacterium]|nr:hypothetical protein [Actinomycetota bacterium]